MVRKTVRKMSMVAIDSGYFFAMTNLSSEYQQCKAPGSVATAPCPLDRSIMPPAEHSLLEVTLVCGFRVIMKAKKRSRKGSP